MRHPHFCILSPGRKQSEGKCVGPPPPTSKVLFACCVPCLPSGAWTFLWPSEAEAGLRVGSKATERRSQPFVCDSTNANAFPSQVAVTETPSFLTAAGPPGSAAIAGLCGRRPV
jgi:hypothetical protein